MHREKTPEAREYDELVQRVSPRSSAGSTALALLKAFGVGGLICCVGQAIRDLGAGPLGLDDKAVSAFTSTALIFLSALLTGLGLYEPLVEWAGAGATVPLTGFGSSLATGAREAVEESGLLGALTGGVTATAAGIAAAIVFGYLASVLFTPPTKR